MRNSPNLSYHHAYHSIQFGPFVFAHLQIVVSHRINSLTDCLLQTCNDVVVFSNPLAEERSFVPSLFHRCHLKAIFCNMDVCMYPRYVFLLYAFLYHLICNSFFWFILLYSFRNFGSYLKKQTNNKNVWYNKVNKKRRDLYAKSKIWWRI